MMMGGGSNLWESGDAPMRGVFVFAQRQRLDFGQQDSVRSFALGSRNDGKKTPTDGEGCQEAVSQLHWAWMWGRWLSIDRYTPSALPLNYAAYVYPDAAEDTVVSNQDRGSVVG